MSIPTLEIVHNVFAFDHSMAELSKDHIESHKSEARNNAPLQFDVCAFICRTAI